MLISSARHSGKNPVDNAGKKPHILAMDLQQDLISKANAFCKETGMSHARLATIVVNDGKFFKRIEAGGGFTTKTYEKFLDFFSRSSSEAAHG